MKKAEVHRLSELPEGILYTTPIHSNTAFKYIPVTPRLKIKKAPGFDDYNTAFSKVMNYILKGNSYLLNLTFPTLIETDSSLEEIFHASVARYKLLYHNIFVLFSPESFVKIDGNGRISSYPMKGTIDASVPDAENVILSNRKEEAEHNTIVDLIRNDLSRFSENVRVDRFRYIDKIKIAGRELIQVSSEISGKLTDEFRNKPGDIFQMLLPAGSVTGAPKKETVRIIKECETDERGWYTGVFGVFDGDEIDSAVMIRFIGKRNGNLYFRSGGGITSMSNVQDEYNELIAKIYVPLG